MIRVPTTDSQLQTLIRRAKPLSNTLEKKERKKKKRKKKSLEFIAALVGSIKDLIKFLPIERHVIINEEE